MSQVSEQPTSVSDIIQLLEETIATAKSAVEERDRLKSALAEKERIILEKVASAAPRATRGEIAGLVGMLIEKGAARKEDEAGLVADFEAHPDNILKLASQLAKISIPAPSNGQGIAKEASTSSTSETDDGWWNVAARGA